MCACVVVVGMYMHACMQVLLTKLLKFWMDSKKVAHLNSFEYLLLKPYFIVSQCNLEATCM